jgi:hypothetical protein
MAVTVTNAVFWDVVLRSALELPVTSNIVPSSLILLALKMEAISSCRMSVLQQPDPRGRHYS